MLQNYVNYHRFKCYICQKFILLKIGIIKEGKTPPDKRVPLTPKQCKWIKDNYPHLDLVVQKSPIRKFFLLKIDLYNRFKKLIIIIP